MSSEVAYLIAFLICYLIAVVLAYWLGNNAGKQCKTCGAKPWMQCAKCYYGGK